MKAQGNQVTKMKVKEVILTHPIGEGKEPWPMEEEVPFEIEGESEKGTSDEESVDGETSVEWDFTKKNDDETPTLFD
jgi:topoisomerase-4 subunit A